MALGVIEAKIADLARDQTTSLVKKLLNKIFGLDEDQLNKVVHEFIVAAKEAQHTEDDIVSMLSVADGVLEVGERGAVKSLSSDDFAQEKLNRLLGVGSVVFNPAELHSAIMRLWRYAQAKDHYKDGLLSIDGRAHLILAITAMVGKIFQAGDHHNETWLKLLEIFLTKVMASDLVKSRQWNKENFFKELQALKKPVKDRLAVLEKRKGQNEVRGQLKVIAEGAQAAGEYMRILLPELYDKPSPVKYGRPKPSDLARGTFIDCIMDAVGFVLPPDKEYLDEVIEERKSEAKTAIADDAALPVEFRGEVARTKATEDFMSIVIAWGGEGESSDARVDPATKLPQKKIETRERKRSEGALSEAKQDLIPRGELTDIRAGNLATFADKQRHKTAEFLAALERLIRREEPSVPRILLDKNANIILISNDPKPAKLLASGIKKEYLTITSNSSDKAKKALGEESHRRKILILQIEMARLVNAVSSLLTLCTHIDKLYRNWGEGPAALLLQRLFPAVKILIEAASRGQGQINTISTQLAGANQVLGTQINSVSSPIEKLQQALARMRKATIEAHARNEHVLLLLSEGRMSLHADLSDIRNSLSNCAELFIISGMLQTGDQETLKTHIGVIAGQLPFAKMMSEGFMQLAGVVKREGALTMDGMQGVLEQKKRKTAGQVGAASNSHARIGQAEQVGEQDRNNPSQGIGIGVVDNHDDEKVWRDGKKNEPSLVYTAPVHDPASTRDRERKASGLPATGSLLGAPRYSRSSQVTSVRSSDPPPPPPPPPQQQLPVIQHNQRPWGWVTGLSSTSASAITIFALVLQFVPFVNVATWVLMTIAAIGFLVSFSAGIAWSRQKNAGQPGTIMTWLSGLLTGGSALTIAIALTLILISQFTPVVNTVTWLIVLLSVTTSYVGGMSLWGYKKDNTLPEESVRSYIPPSQRSRDPSDAPVPKDPFLQQLFEQLSDHAGVEQIKGFFWQRCQAMNSACTRQTFERLWGSLEHELMNAEQVMVYKNLGRKLENFVNALLNEPDFQAMMGITDDNKMSHYQIILTALSTFLREGHGIVGRHSDSPPPTGGFYNNILSRLNESGESPGKAKALPTIDLLAVINNPAFKQEIIEQLSRLVPVDRPTLETILFNSDHSKGEPGVLTATRIGDYAETEDMNSFIEIFIEELGGQGMRDKVSNLPEKLEEILVNTIQQHKQITPTPGQPSQRAISEIRAPACIPESKQASPDQMVTITNIIELVENNRDGIIEHFSRLLTIEKSKLEKALCYSGEDHGVLTKARLNEYLQEDMSLQDFSSVFWEELNGMGLAQLPTQKDIESFFVEAANAYKVEHGRSAMHSAY